MGKSASDFEKARRFSAALAVCLRWFGKHVPSQMAELICAVQLNEGQRLNELARAVRGRPSTVSRQLLDLAEFKRDGKPGHGIVEIRPDPLDPCANNYFLSPKGRQFMLELATALKGDAPELSLTTELPADAEEETCGNHSDAV